MTVWSIGDTLGMIATNETASFFWERIGSVGASFVGVSFLYFVLTVLYPEKATSKPRLFWLFFPATILSILTFFTPIFITGVKKMAWGYMVDNTSYFIFLSLYVSGLTAWAIIVAINSLRKLNDLQKRQMGLFIIAYLIPLSAGIVTEVVAPYFGWEIPPLTMASSGIAVIIIFYAIKKYEFLSISPALALSQIFNTIDDILIVLDEKNQIVLTNNAIEKNLGFVPSELIGDSLAVIFNNPKSSVAENNEDYFNRTWKDQRVEISSKDGTKKIPFLINGSYIFSSGIKRGLVLVMRNMSQIDELLINLKKKTEESEFSKKELIKNLEELKKMNNFMVDRELKIVELKKQILELQAKNNSFNLSK